MKLRSMTGFARVRRSGPAGEFTVNMKSLNHRGLDVHFHSPSELDPYEPALRALVKMRVSRGHIEVRIQWTRGVQDASLGLNRPLLEAWLAAFRVAADAYGLRGEPDLNQALRLPDMLDTPDTPVADPQIETLLAGALTEALDALNGFREREGAELGEIMRERCAGIEQAAASIDQIRSAALPAFNARLAERLGEMLRGIAVDPQRLAQEAAIIADRSDIGEEVARLRIHAGQVRQSLDAGGEVGKKLDFLLQEMNREANTILSKTAGVGETGLGITDLALAVKADIEKIREQSLNLE